MYAQWDDVTVVVIQLNYNYEELESSAEMTVDGNDYLLLQTLTYRVPAGETITTTIEFSTPHPWMKTTDGSYYYLRKFATQNILGDP